jgi:hypothetical protein
MTYASSLCQLSAIQALYLSSGGLIAASENGPKVRRGKPQAIRVSGSLSRVRSLKPGDEQSISWVSKIDSGFFTKLEPLEERGRH